MSDTYRKPARVPQRVMSVAMARRVRGLVYRKAWDIRDIETILFNQGFGRKSIALVLFG